MTKTNNKVCGKHRWADKMEGQVSRENFRRKQKCKELLEKRGFYGR